MSVDYKKFLPKQMRDTRWGELMEVIQDMTADLKRDKIRPIFDQFDITKASDSELLDYANYYGYTILSLTGLSSTSLFLKKQVSTIIPKIKYKTTYNVYSYVGIPYGLTAKAHNTVYNYSNNTIIVLENQSDSQQYVRDPVTTLDWGSPNIIYYTDQYYMDYTDLTLDSDLITELGQQVPVYTEPNPNPNPDLTLDDPIVPTMDMEFSLSMISRVFVFSYKPNFVENANEFLSSYSLKSLKNDITQVKRATDFVYYEPVLAITANADKTVTTKTWRDFTGVDTATQQTILIGDSLLDTSKIRLGNSSHEIVFSGIPDVASFTKEFTYSGCTWYEELPNSLKGRPNIIENQHFSGVTEIAFLDEADNCILYSKFPEVHWDPDLLSNIKFEIQYV